MSSNFPKQQVERSHKVKHLVHSKKYLTSSRRGLCDIYHKNKLLLLASCWNNIVPTKVCSATAAFVQGLPTAYDTMYLGGGRSRTRSSMLHCHSLNLVFVSVVTHVGIEP